MTEFHSTGSGQWRYSKSGSAMLAFAAITAFFLVTEHRALRRVGNSSNESTRRTP